LRARPERGDEAYSLYGESPREDVRAKMPRGRRPQQAAGHEMRSSPRRARSRGRYGRRTIAFTGEVV